MVKLTKTGTPWLSRPPRKQQAVIQLLSASMGEWVMTTTLINHVYGKVTYNTTTALWQVMSRLRRNHPGHFEHRRLGWGVGQYRMVEPL